MVMRRLPPSRFFAFFALQNSRPISYVEHDGMLGMLCRHGPCGRASDPSESDFLSTIRMHRSASMPIGHSGTVS